MSARHCAGFAAPLLFLDGRAPSEVLETDDGVALAGQTVSRTEHDVFS
jgi:uncharacterized protein (DUF2384 family)